MSHMDEYESIAFLFSVCAIFCCLFFSISFGSTPIFELYFIERHAYRHRGHHTHFMWIWFSYFWIYNNRLSIRSHSRGYAHVASSGAKQIKSQTFSFIIRMCVCVYGLSKLRIRGELAINLSLVIHHMNMFKSIESIEHIIIWIKLKCRDHIMRQ